jgi:endonuclease YncB( thermonuclease family)
MPFILIKGTFHLVNLTKNGKETGFEPDGDSIQFKPSDQSLLDQLEQLGRAYKLSKIGSVQLRFEGIDALELHYKPSKGGKVTHQRRALAKEARDFLTEQLGLNPVNYAPPDEVRVKPPVEKDATPGYILSRSLEVHGRPVSFVFAGDPPPEYEDGEEVNLKIPLLKKSLNYKLIQNGHAYPLFYETLFADLREALAKAAQQAREKKRGLWQYDRSTDGLKVSGQESLETDGVIFPKLFRRLTDYLAESNDEIDGFLEWLQKKKEQVQDLDTLNFTHFDNILELKGNRIKMRQSPEKLVFISAK